MIAGNANHDLADGIAEWLDVKLEKSDIRRFSDGEINIHVHENVRGADVFIIQPMCPPNVNDNIMELLLLIHTLRLSSAKRVTAIVPYYAYGRQDRFFALSKQLTRFHTELNRKVKPRVPISASVVAQLMEVRAHNMILHIIFNLV